MDSFPVGAWGLIESATNLFLVLLWFLFQTQALKTLLGLFHFTISRVSETKRKPRGCPNKKSVDSERQRIQPPYPLLWVLGVLRKLGKKDFLHKETDLGLLRDGYDHATPLLRHTQKRHEKTWSVSQREPQEKGQEAKVGLQKLSIHTNTHTPLIQACVSGLVSTRRYKR